MRRAALLVMFLEPVCSTHTGTRRAHHADWRAYLHGAESYALAPTNRYQARVASVMQDPNRDLCFAASNSSLGIATQSLQPVEGLMILVPSYTRQQQQARTEAPELAAQHQRRFSQERIAKPLPGAYTARIEQVEPRGLEQRVPQRSGSCVPN